jgi:hypothetical protein
MAIRNWGVQIINELIYFHVREHTTERRK